MDLEKLQYPIGKFQYSGEITKRVIDGWIDEIAALPQKLRMTVENLTEEQLNTQYRPDGWTIRQVVHHLADSHLNSLIRFKLSLTEETPTIRPYFEDRWAELPDYRLVPLETVLNFLDHLHEMWLILLRSLNEKDLARQFYHPESNEHIDLATNIGIYAWHCRHHLAHITTLIEKKGWKTDSLP